MGFSHLRALGVGLVVGIAACHVGPAGGVDADTDDEPDFVALLPCEGPDAPAFDVISIDAQTHEIVRFDPAMTFEPVLVATPRAEGSDAQRIDEPYDVAVSPTGQVYVANFGSGAIVRLGPDGGAAEEVYFDRGVLEEPTALSFAGDALWVVGNDTKNLVRVDPQGGGRLAMVGGDASIPWPLGMAIDPAGARGYVIATGARRGERVSVWDLERGVRIEAFGDAELDEVRGIALGCRGEVWVSTADAVVRYEPARVANGTPEGPFTVERVLPLAGVRRLKAGPSGKVYASAEDGLYALLDDATGFEPATAPLGRLIRSFAFVPRD